MRSMVSVNELRFRCGNGSRSIALILSAEGGFFVSCIHSMTASSNLGKSSDKSDLDAQLP